MAKGNKGGAVKAKDGAGKAKDTPKTNATAPKDGKKKKRPAPTTFGLTLGKGKGKGTATSATGADGVVRTRAQWTGADGTYSLCSLLKWVGKNGGDINNARAMVTNMGLEDVTSASTVSCQFYAGLALANGEKPNHSGPVAPLSKKDAATVKTLAGM